MTNTQNVIERTTPVDPPMTHGPISAEQHERVISLPENEVRTIGYCWLAYWVPGHPIHGPHSCPGETA